MCGCFVWLIMSEYFSIICVDKLQARRVVQAGLIVVVIKFSKADFRSQIYTNTLIESRFRQEANPF